MTSRDAAAQPLVAAADAVSVTLNLDMAVVRGRQCGLGASVGLAAELFTLGGRE